MTQNEGKVGFPRRIARLSVYFIRHPLLGARMTVAVLPLVLHLRRVNGEVFDSPNVPSDLRRRRLDVLTQVCATRIMRRIRPILPESLSLNQEEYFERTVALLVTETTNDFLEQRLKSFRRRPVTSRIVQAPGGWLRGFAELLVSRTTFEGVFEPLLAELAAEWMEAYSQGRFMKAWIVRLRWFVVYVRNVVDLMFDVVRPFFHF